MFFSSLYAHLKIVVKKGRVNVDYGVSYSLSIGLFAGPLGLFIFETIHRFTVYLYRKAKNTADPDEFIHTFYNIGSFTLNHSIAYFLFFQIYPLVSSIPFGFWILIIFLVLLVSLLSDAYLSIIFAWMGDMKTFKDAINFFKSRSILDMGKLAFTNGLLFIFLKENQWEMLICFFVLNYLVSRSFFEKSESLQHKMERDKFEQMAYTDFLTEVYNRAFMDKTMAALNNSGEKVGIIVADIDFFKQINDTYNHAVGDRVIQHVAATIQECLSDDDYLFRSGGEEFTIILRHREYEACVDLVEQMREKIAATPAISDIQEKQVELTITASFGMYFYRTNEVFDIHKAYIFADQLLLQSKKRGRNTTSTKNGMSDLPLSMRFHP